MERLKRIIVTSLPLLLPSLCTATAVPPYHGVNLSIAAYPKDPPTLRGAQLMLTYNPAKFKWRQFNILFDGGYSYFWLVNRKHNTNISILSAAPIIRYTFKQRGCVKPFLDLSIGIAYMNRTRLDNRNLGIHFSFQDRLGIGVLFGAADQFSIGLHAVHYSNANLSEHNSGISVPIVADFGYRF